MPGSAAKRTAPREVTGRNLCPAVTEVAERTRALITIPPRSTGPFALLQPPAPQECFVDSRQLNWTHPRQPPGGVHPLVGGACILEFIKRGKPRSHGGNEVPSLPGLIVGRLSRTKPSNPNHSGLVDSDLLTLVRLFFPSILRASVSPWFIPLLSEWDEAPPNNGCTPGLPSLS